VRELLRIVRAHDRGQVPAGAVADHLASLNKEVHCRISRDGDKSVGPRCIVAWRYRKGGAHKGGGASLFYTGTTRDNGSNLLPIIAGGMDVAAISRILMPRMIDAARAGKPIPPVSDEIKEEWARLPDKPDEKLR
jgi:hypothetical protein